MDGTKALLTIAFSIFIFGTGVAQWETSKDVDKMTGEGSSYAHSPSAYADEAMGFPYNNVRAWLGVGCNGSSEWSYIGFSDDPNLVDTETEDGYDIIRTRIRFDQTVETVKLTQDWGANFLHFSIDEPIIKKMRASNTMLLELNWYSEGNVYFEFDLSGSSNAINKIRSECKDYK